MQGQVKAAARSEISLGKPWLLVTMYLAVLLAQVDTSVVNLAIHAIGHSLGTGVSGLRRVLDAYNLTYALLLLTGGLLADLCGRRRLFPIGATIFTGGSTLCAAAPSIQVLIAARAIAGAGAARRSHSTRIGRRQFGELAMASVTATAGGR